MILHVETGEGSRDANSYVVLADADAYHRRQQSAWDGSDLLRSLALIAATRFLDDRFTWLGTPKTEDQGLAWPREIIGQWDSRPFPKGVPPAIRRACAVAAGWWLNAVPRSKQNKSCPAQNAESLLQSHPLCFPSHGEERYLTHIVQRFVCSGTKSAPSVLHQRTWDLTLSAF